MDADGRARRSPINLLQQLIDVKRSAYHQVIYQ
jgi:hypothetical protein